MSGSAGRTRPCTCGAASTRSGSAKDVEPITGETIALHVNFQDLIDRVIYLDGRPHPPEEAPHTWAGFSTGKWEGDMLTVTTTHLKEYIIRRDGVPVSDRSTMIEHWMRHGDYLTSRPDRHRPGLSHRAVHPVHRFRARRRTSGTRPNLCEVEEESDHPKGWVPHRLPGTANEDEEFAKKHNLPVEAVKGGAETMYPEYRAKLKQAEQP